jgi:hypothetical protein
MPRSLRSFFHCWINFAFQIDELAPLRFANSNCSTWNNLIAKYAYRCRQAHQLTLSRVQINSNRFEHLRIAQSSPSIPKQEDVDTLESLYPWRKVRRSRIPNRERIRLSVRARSPHTTQCGRAPVSEILLGSRWKFTAVWQDGSYTKRAPVRSVVLHGHSANATVNCFSQKVAYACRSVSVTIIDCRKGG